MGHEWVTSWTQGLPHGCKYACVTSWTGPSCTTDPDCYCRCSFSALQHVYRRYSSFYHSSLRTGRVHFPQVRDTVYIVSLSTLVYWRQFGMFQINLSRHCFNALHVELSSVSYTSFSSSRSFLPTRTFSTVQCH